MKIIKYVYLIPLICALILIMRYIITSNKFYRFGKEKKGINNMIIMPKKGSKLYNRYKKFLQNTRLTVKKMFIIKNFIFICALILAMLVKYTNIIMYTRNIHTIYNYSTDLIYELNDKSIDKEKLFNKEIYYLDIAQDIISSREILQNQKENIQHKIENIISKDKNIEKGLEKIIANKVYHRLYDYYKCRQFNLALYILISIILSFTPEAFIFLVKIFTKSDIKKELRFLKRLILMNGSIKPVDFMKLLNTLIDKSKYYKKILQEIEEKNKINMVDNKQIYFNYIKDAPDLESKLFFEKLDQANNYNFDQVIMNIKNELRLEKRESIRKVKKEVEAIHIFGIVGYMVIITIVLLYLLVPWLQEYNMNEIM